MKTILVYCTQLLERGGIESHILQFCQVMSERGLTIDLIVARSKITASDLANYRLYCRDVFINPYGQGKRGKAWLIAKIGQLVTRRYQAIYTNGQGNSIALVGRLAGIGRRWVHHHHTSGDEMDRGTWPDAYRDIFKRADKSIACSTRNASMMTASLNVPIDTIPCFSRQVSLPKRVVTDDEKEPIHMGYFGRLIPEKGIELLCALSKDVKLTNFRFHIWGVPTSRYHDAYFAQYPNVIFHGSFSGYEELCQVIAEIDIFLLLSVHPEGLPISLLEVMSSGTPWIATNRGGIPDIAVDEDFTVVLPPTPEYAPSLRAILDMATKLGAETDPGSRLRKLYKKKFSAHAVAEQWLEAFELA